MDNAEATKLRNQAAAVVDAVEARIRNDTGSIENLRRATQAVQITGMGISEYWTSLLFQPLENICLIMAQEIGILPAINESSSFISAAALAKDLDSDKLIVARIMRVLTSAGICDEVCMETYRANALSTMAAGLGGQAGIKKVNEVLFLLAGQVQPYIRQHGVQRFLRESEDPDLAQFSLGGQSVWQYLKSNPKMKYWFDMLMAESRRNDVPWYQIYPLRDQLGQACEQSPSGVSLVDIGGNRGADLLEFRQANPELRGRLILQDLPETICEVDASVMGGIELQAYDIFTPQPIKAARAYFLKRVLHDFDDDSVRRFLPNTVGAMNEDSRLLIQELVLPGTNASAKASHLDILMMLYHSGLERTYSQWMALLEICGLEVVKIWSRLDTDPSIIECRKKR